MSSLGGTFQKGLQDTASCSGGRSRRPLPFSSPPHPCLRPFPGPAPFPQPSAEGHLKGWGPCCFVPKSTSGFLRFCEALAQGPRSPHR